MTGVLRVASSRLTGVTVLCSTQEDRKSSQHDGKIVDCDVKQQRQTKQNNYNAWSYIFIHLGIYINMLC